jgi:hypothetical protein
LVRTTGTVPGVMVQCRANKSDSGPRGLKVVAKEGGGHSAFTTQVPDIMDGVDTFSYTFGASFTIAVDGRITALRFYRAVGPPAPMTSRSMGLWTNEGVLLASATTSSETGSGWKTAILATPVTVTAGMVVRVGYQATANTGWVTTQFAGAISVTNGNVTKTQAYNIQVSSLTFPSTSSPHEYFADLVFEPGITRSSADNALTTTFTDYPLPLEKKNDGTAWTIADINALGIGVEVGS